MLEELGGTQFEELTQLEDNSLQDQVHNSNEEEVETNTFIHEEKLKNKYSKDPLNLQLNGIIYQRGGDKWYAFFQDQNGSLDITLRRSEECSIVLPSEAANIKSGISGKAIRLVRNNEGSMVVTSTNRHGITIKDKVTGKVKKKIDKLYEGKESEMVGINIEDEIMFPNGLSSIFFHKTVKVSSIEDESISVAILHELKQARITIEEIESNNDKEILSSLLPGMITRLKNLLPPRMWMTKKRKC